MTKSSLIESHCLPPIPVVQSWFNSTELILESCENYQKRSFRNRVYIGGPNGMQLLTIPLVKGKNNGKSIEDVQISYDEDWVKQWLFHIQTAYSNAPYYIYYYPSLQQLINSRPAKLWDLNMALLSWTLDVLRADIEVSSTGSYEKTPPPTFQNLRGLYTPQSLNSLEVNIIYGQVHEANNGFIPHLSILDLIMCCGIEARQHLLRKA